MVKQWLFIPMVMALGVSVSVAPGSDRRTGPEVAGPKQGARTAQIPLYRCVRACLDCDQGNMLSCVICATCSEPALTATR